jgi:hypothetical protein
VKKMEKEVGKERDTTNVEVKKWKKTRKKK